MSNRITNKDGSTNTLLMALDVGNINKAQELVDNDTDFDANSYFSKLLQHDSTQNKLRSVKWLLNKGYVDPGYRDGRHIRKAVNYTNPRYLFLLLNAGGTINNQGEQIGHVIKKNEERPFFDDDPARRYSKDEYIMLGLCLSYALSNPIKNNETTIACQILSIQNLAPSHLFDRTRKETQYIRNKFDLSLPETQVPDEIKAAINI